MIAGGGINLNEEELAKYSGTFRDLYAKPRAIGKAKVKDIIHLSRNQYEIRYTLYFLITLV